MLHHSMSLAFDEKENPTGSLRKVKLKLLVADAGFRVFSLIINTHEQDKTNACVCNFERIEFLIHQSNIVV